MTSLPPDKLPKRNVLGIGVTQAPYAAAVQHLVELAQQRVSAYVCVANAHMLVEANQDHSFWDVLDQAELVTPDGKPLSVMMNWLYQTQQERVAGPDLMVSLFERAEAENLRLFLFGSTPQVLEAITQKAKQLYPQLTLAGQLSPPFQAISPAEEEAMIQQINDSGANLVLVALGCPKQERWMHAHSPQIQGVLIGVGAAFPFFSGDLNRAPHWMQNASLEWLYRLYCEPRRLFQRYLITNSRFMLLALIQLFKHYTSPKPNPDQ